VLPLVLVIALLLSAAILSFVRRSVVDSMMVRNRQATHSADALARGGIHVATGILFIQRYSEDIAALENRGRGGTTLMDPWATLHQAPFETQGGEVLTIRIEDAGMRFNLNSLVPGWKPVEESQPEDEAEEFLADFIERIIDENELVAEGIPYEPREMARNLLDYMDADDVAIGGRNEDDYYLAQDPPRVTPRRPLLSVAEVGMIEGFDMQFVEAMAPYVTVQPLLGDEGININTAPPHVLSLVYHGSSGDKRLADEDVVREIMQVRSEGAIVCNKQAPADVDCRTLSEVGLGEGSIFPPVTLPMRSTVFTVTAEARVGEVVRTVEAVIDLSVRTEPRLLSWKAL
jgi:type II secretory pathway component PulK